MKITSLLFLCFLCHVGNVSAQDRQFKPFKVEIAGGVGIVNSGRTGYLLSVEPKYSINDQFSVGLRTESLVVYQKPIGSLSTIGTLAVRFYGVTSDRYVHLGNKNRLSAGAAVGVYQYALGTADREDYKALSRSNFGAVRLGVAPRLGFELSHLRLGIEYNAVLQQTDLPINYFSAKVGLLLGGGKY